MSRPPLEGVRVLELGLAVAGPLAGHVLGDMGADVIKVEAPFARSKTPSEYVHPASGVPAEDPWNRVSKFNELNRSKRSLTLNLARPEGRAVFLKLASVADVVLENYSSRVLRNLGIDYDTLIEHNPSIILVSMPGFGRTGPYASRVSYGPGIDAMSGLAHLSGYRDSGPIKPGNHYCDQNAGMMAALATMAALRHRRKTGQGQRVEVAMLDGGIQSVGETIVAASAGVTVQPRQGNRSESAAPQGVFRCLGDDRWVAISVTDDAAWQQLCAVTGRSDLASDPELATLAGRVTRQDEIEDAIGAWCATRENGDVQRLLQAAGVSAGAALKPSEVLTDPHLVARGAHPLIPHPSVGPSPVPAVAWQFHEHPVPPTIPAPRFGEDNDAVLHDLAGLTADEIDALREQKIVVDSPISGGE